MDLQKIIGALIILSCLLFCSCGSSTTEPNIINTTSIDSVVIDTSINIDRKVRENCLEDIGLEMADSVFLYWAEIAINKNYLYDHAGNDRIVLTKDKKFYYSSNKGPIESVDNYFNTDLFFFKNFV